MKGLNIVKSKLNKSEITNFSKPNFVYIPMISANDTNITILVKKGDTVLKGSVIGKRKGDMRLPIHSSVSGTVTDIQIKTCYNGQKVKCVVIENDFKEKIEPIEKKELNEYTKESFIDMLHETGIIGMGGAGFPAYVKYDNNIKTLIINAVECEPNIEADYILIKNKCEEILEAIDTIMEINGIEEGIIAISDGNKDLKDVFSNYIGTYLKIKLKIVPHLYPLGWERKLIKEVKNVSYDKFPIEKDIVVSNVSTVYAIYQALKYGKPLIERIITITGDALEEPKNVLVKNGTLVKDILDSFDLKTEYNIISGGPMMGIKVDDELVISSNMNCVLVLKEISIDHATECLRCGKCVEVCPAKLSPVLIMNNLHTKDNLKQFKPENCVECGLCSYICPAKIIVRESIRKAKELLKEEK